MLIGYLRSEPMLRDGGGLLEHFIVTMRRREILDDQGGINGDGTRRAKQRL